MAPDRTSLEELRALADHTRNRVALYRRKIYTGGGTAVRLAELERIAQGANDRFKRARAAAKRDAG